MQQPVKQTGCNAPGVVSRMIGLQARGQTSRQTKGSSKASDDAALAGDQHQILQSAYLADRSHHLRRQPRCQRGERSRVSGIPQKPVAKIADRQMLHHGESRCILRIQNQPRDGIALIRNNRLVQKNRQRHISQSHLRRHAFPRIGGCRTGQLVPRTQGARTRHERAQIGKGKTTRADGMVKGHGLFQVAKQTEIGDEPVRTSYYSRMLGVRSRSMLIGCSR